MPYLLLVPWPVLKRLFSSLEQCSHFFYACRLAQTQSCLAYPGLAKTPIPSRMNLTPQLSPKPDYQLF